MSMQADPVVRVLDTVRPKDRMDAEALRRKFGLEGD
jgi:hypothetical protein